METVGNRIRVERERLGLTQSELGVAPKTQGFYESGKRKPDSEYLQKFSDLGADVLYILTGRRDTSQLASDEAALVDNYRAAPEAGRRAIRGAALACSKPEADGSVKEGAA